MTEDHPYTARLRACQSKLDSLRPCLRGSRGGKWQAILDEMLALENEMAYLILPSADERDTGRKRARKVRYDAPPGSDLAPPSTWTDDDTC